MRETGQWLQVAEIIFGIFEVPRQPRMSVVRGRAESYWRVTHTTSFMNGP